MTLGPSDDKHLWRAWARPIADTPLDAGAERLIVDHIAAFLADRDPVTVILYSAMPHEIEVGGLRTVGDHRYGITRTPATGWLTLHPVDVAHERHRYGFRQPVAGAEEIPPVEVGVVILPGLAFDRSGFRLGHGAGYYDELCSRLPADVIRIGVVRAALVVEALPVEAHDLPMTHIATESGIVAVGSVPGPSGRR